MLGFDLQRCEEERSYTLLSEGPWLQQLGNLVACDLILNNDQRTNLIWDGQGFPENIFFKVNGEKLQSIEELDEPGLDNIEVEGLISLDGRTVPLDTGFGGEGRDYLNKMADFLNGVFKDIESLKNRDEATEFQTPKNANSLTEVPFASVQKLIDFLRFYTRSSIFEKSDLNQVGKYRDNSGYTKGHGTGRLAIKLMCGILMGLTTIVLKREELLTKMKKVL